LGLKAGDAGRSGDANQLSDEPLGRFVEEVVLPPLDPVPVEPLVELLVPAEVLDWPDCAEVDCVVPAPKPEVAPADALPEPLLPWMVPLLVPVPDGEPLLPA
jgi:hypothetical protein